MTMHTFTAVSGASLAYVQHGDGAAVLVLHGGYSTHHEIESVIEPIVSPLDEYRRIYPDLTGSGDSPGHASIGRTDDLVTLLEALIDELVGEAAVTVIGHSFRAHIGRGLAARRPDQVVGLAMICPLVPDMEGEPHTVVAADAADAVEAIVGVNQLEEFRGYFVVHTSDAARRFVEHVAPSVGRYDGEAVERTMNGDITPDIDRTRFDAPVLIVLGRGDSLVGYRKQLALADVYAHASLMLVDGAGHALPHERPELLRAAVTDWLQSITPAPRR